MRLEAGSGIRERGAVATRGSAITLGVWSRRRVLTPRRNAAEIMLAVVFMTGRRGSATRGAEWRSR
jgi:hypothetical protein